MADAFLAGSWIRHGAFIDESTIEPGTFIGFRATIRHATIGTGAQLAARAQVLGTPDRPIRIGDGAWIGVGAIVRPGVSVGAHAVIGAGSQVCNDIPAQAIYYGRPATPRGTTATRFDQGDGIEHVMAMVRKRGPRDTTRLDERFPADPEGYFDCRATIGPDVTVGRAAIMIGRPDGPSMAGGITIGPQATLGDHLIAEGVGGLTIGARTTLGDTVTITTSTHDHRIPGRPWTAAPVDIAADVAIGDGAIIVGPVRIGEGAVIAPHTVVIRSVAPRQQ